MLYLFGVAGAGLVVVLTLIFLYGAQMMAATHGEDDEP